MPEGTGGEGASEKLAESRVLTSEEMLAAETKEPFELTLLSGKVIRIRGYLSYNDLVAYERAQDQKLSPRDAFLAMLEGASDKEAMASELGSLSDGVLAGIVHRYLDTGGRFITPPTDATGDIFEVFDAGVRVARKRIGEAFANILGRLPKFESPIVTLPKVPEFRWGGIPESLRSDLDGGYRAAQSLSPMAEVVSDLKGVVREDLPVSGFFEVVEVLRETQQQQLDWNQRQAELARATKEVIDRLTDVTAQDAALSSRYADESNRASKKTHRQNAWLQVLAVLGILATLLMSLFRGEIRAWIQRVFGL
jgi:hypothetical protein